MTNSNPTTPQPNYTITREQLDNWFNQPTQVMPWSTIAANMAEVFGIDVSETDCKAIFRANGYNLRNRKQSANLADLVTVIEPTVSTEPVLEDVSFEANYGDTTDSPISFETVENGVV